METNSAERVLITFEQVRAAVAESLGKDVAEVLPTSSFVSLDADSMDKAQLILDLEEALKVELPDDDAGKFVTVQDLVKYCNDPRSHRI